MVCKNLLQHFMKNILHKIFFAENFVRNNYPLIKIRRKNNKKIFSCKI